MGALDKCSYYINAVRDSAQNAVLVFDAGDFLPAIPDSEQAEYILRAMREVGYDAMVVGDQEFLIGQSNFERVFHTTVGEPDLPPKDFQFFILDENSPGVEIRPIFPNVLLGNVQYRNGKSLFINKNIVPLPQVETAVNTVGVIAPSSFLFFPSELAGWFETVAWNQSLLDKFPPDSLIVLLSHSGLMTDVEIARAFPDIDIIIGGHSQNELPAPVIEGETLIVQAGGFGRYVGRLDLRLKEGNIAEYQYQLVPMTPDIPSDTALLAIIEEYEHTFFRDKRPRPHIPVYPDTLEIYSPSVCGKCHSAEYAEWQKEVHSQAFDILQSRRKIYNPGCLSCHTTGFGHKHGFVSYDKTPEWCGIGCTECHYTPSAHLLEPDIKPLPIAESVCLRCHTPRNSPDFDFSGYRARAAHK